MGVVGSNAVRVDIGHEYPRLYPVFNVSLIVCYKNPGEFGRPFLNDGIKERYHLDHQVVDWSKLGTVLDARRQGGHREYLLRWLQSTPGKDTWVREDHIPSSPHGYLESFRAHLDQHYGPVRSRRKKRK